MDKITEGAAPKITVCVVTYNQEKYIAQCLQSIVDQKTDFTFEVIVSDDCSTDNTRVVIQEFADTYSNIRLVLRDENIGALENFKQTHMLADGDFVCHCDGDDFWLPGKLQIQASYLLNNEKCNLVWCRMKIKDEGNDSYIPDLISNNVLNMQFLRGDIIQLIAIGLHSSKMYRNGEIDSPKFPMVDYYANVEQVSDGYACFVGDDCYGVYRAGIGIASDGNGTKVIIAQCLNHFKVKYPELSGRVLACLYLLILVEFKNRRWENLMLYVNELSLRGSLSGVYYLVKALPLVKNFRLPNFG